MLPLKRDGNCIELIDQRGLPERVQWNRISEYRRMVAAIAELEVRGAPAIGCAGAYGVCLAVKEALILPPEQQQDFLETALAELRTVRPTAVNLTVMVDRMAATIDNRLDPALLDRLWLLADELMREDQEHCRRIGHLGAGLISNGGNYLTHCNAGGLATSGFGSALALFFQARQDGKQFQVWVDETRPLLQGARITTFELLEAGIPATLVTDSMAAHLMQQKRVDGVVVGADRIAANGDTANKIGTLGLAVLAQHFGVPFHVVATQVTIDRKIATGEEITIEERDGDEIRRMGDCWIAPRTVATYNPAFDITPAGLITGIITEQGIHNYPFAF